MGTTAAEVVRSAPRTEVAVSVLGPIEVRRGGVVVDLGTPKQRALVAALALAQGRPVSVDAIVGLLWGERPPAGVTGTLQAYVSGIRRALEPTRLRRAPAQVLVTVTAGYALRLAEGSTDAAGFEAVVTEEHRRVGRPLLDQPRAPAPRLAATAARLSEALAMWRGEPYTELDDAPEVVAERARLEELRVVALEDRAVARLALGEHATVVGELESLTSAYPLRERLWALRALALVRSGRQAEALEVLDDVRRVLADDLGIDPGAELRDLQGRVLRQDPALTWVPPPPTTADLRTSSEPAAPATTPHDVRSSGVRSSGVRSSEMNPSSGRGYDGHDRLLTAEAPWPMLGRDDDLRRLTDALTQAAGGRTSFAVVTGEPGIGKSRLCAELADHAAATGAEVLLGRCSQDDGAPPLWPWTTVLDRLGASVPTGSTGSTGEPQEPGAEFRTWESIARVVRDSAVHRPVLLVLDDLHWADTATLRVLRLLAETSTGDRLLVVTTWRDRPRPAGALGDVAETLARRHAIRVELRGLDRVAVAGVVTAVTAHAPSLPETAALRERTEGNPFFLVEYARLAGAGQPLAALLHEEHPPTAVQEVLSRRLDRLPPDTLRTLRGAAVVGRSFDVPTVAGALGLDEDAVLDDVEPAQAAGLVREDGVDRFSFSHALVRDTIAATLSPSRRARTHASVAATVAGVPGRETEAARHWLHAGDAHAAQAWRAASEAAGVAMQAHAHQEAADLCRAALEAMERDRDHDLRDEYTLLMQLVSAYRWAAHWPHLTATVERAIEVADRIGDLTLTAEAAIATTQGALWQSASDGEVHDRVVAALRRCLDGLPSADAALRCRVMLSLAHELYYASSQQERRALVDEALAMAERLDDPRLLLDAHQIAFVTLWVPTTARERLQYAERAVALARHLGDDHAWVVSATLRAVALNELGRPAEMWAAAMAVRAECERLHIHYGLLVLDTMAVGWRAMAGDAAECERLMGSIVATSKRVSLKHSEDAVAGAFLSVARWQGRPGDVVDGLREMEGGPFEISATVIVFLWAAGREDEARAYAGDHPIRLEHDTWFSGFAWCHAAEAALYLGRPDLGAAVYGRLAPLAGQCGAAGSGNACGPVDGYLALAAASVGETALATRHADAALAQCEEWQVPRCAQWLRALRDRYGF